MPRVMVVRYAEKGNGTNAPKNHLSPQGEVDARALGANLPESMRGAPIAYVGGSIHIRSVQTAMLIALGAGADPVMLPSHSFLGSEKEFFQLADKKAFNTALAENNGSVIKAARLTLGVENYNFLKNNIFSAISHGCRKLDGNVIIGTHNPYIQLLYEHILNEDEEEEEEEKEDLLQLLNEDMPWDDDEDDEVREYNGDAIELSYIIVDVTSRGKVTLVETNLPSQDSSTK